MARVSHCLVKKTHVRGSPLGSPILILAIITNTLAGLSACQETMEVISAGYPNIYIANTLAGLSTCQETVGVIYAGHPTGYVAGTLAGPSCQATAGVYLLGMQCRADGDIAATLAVLLRDRGSSLWVYMTDTRAILLAYCWTLGKRQGVLQHHLMRAKQLTLLREFPPSCQATVVASLLLGSMIGPVSATLLYLGLWLAHSHDHTPVNGQVAKQSNLLLHRLHVI